VTTEEIRNGIMTYITNNWSTTEIEYPNQNFDDNLIEAWIRPVIIMGNSFIGELGSGGIGEGGGVLMISIFVKLGTGTKTGNDYGDSLTTLFRKTDEIEGIVFDEPFVHNVGKEEKKNLFHIMFTVDFHFFIGE